MVGREDYEDRKQAKADRYGELADKARVESNARAKTAHDIGANIPFGQPILVGHHSEGRARRDAEKIWNNMEKSVEASEKAAYYADKADTVENNNAISSDDPQAVDKLNEKLDSLLKEQAFMKKVNAYYRKRKTCVGCEGVDDDYAQKLDDSMKTAYSWETAPYASCTLTNLNARIKAAKDRITRLEKVDEMPHEVIAFEGGQIISNAEINRVQIVFDERQDEEMTATLKSNGFHWSPTEKAWQRLRTPGALRRAKYVLGIE